MAKITPKIRTVLLLIFLTGSSITAYANYTSSFLNFLEIEYEDGNNIITADPYNSNFSKEKQIHDFQKSFDFSIEKKISQLFANPTLKSRIQTKILRQDLTHAYFKFPTYLSSSFLTDPCIDDTEPPVISHNGDQNLNTDPTVCGASFTVSATATDNCFVGTPTGARSDGAVLGAVFPVGTTTINWNVTDVNGVDASQVVQTINVTDNEPPVISHNGDQNLNTDPTVCGASFTVSATATDNCSVGAPTGARSDGAALGAIFPVGTTTINWNVTDVNGVDASQVVQTISVTDNEPPVISHNGDQNLNTDPTVCGASFTVSATATDNCLVGAPTGIRSDGAVLGAVFPVGSTTINWNVTDDNGVDASQVVQTINVTDIEAPVISYNGNQNLNTDPTVCGASFTISATVTDNCSVGTPTGIRSDGAALGAVFPVGTTTINWNVTDDNGVDASQVVQTINVTDNEAPVISHNGNQNLNTDPTVCGASFTVSATATDNCSVGTPTGTRSDGAVLGAVFPVGTTTINWNVTDDNGVDASQVVQTINVTDNEAPVISHNSNQNLNTDPTVCGASFTVSATVTDNCSVGAPTGIRSDGAALGTVFPVGTTTINWNVTDDNGVDASQVVQTINVTDNEPPVAPVLADIIWGCEYTLTPPVATDNCTGSITGTTTSALTYSTSGTYSITWTFTDGAGNFSTTTQQITIDQLQVDIEQTNIYCYGFATGEVKAIVTGGVGPFTYDWGSLGTGPSKDGLNPGTYSVTVKDKNGCSSQVSATITQPFPLLADISYSNVSCNGSNDGSIIITSPSGGYGTFEYSLGGIDWQATGSFLNLPKDTYSVQVRDKAHPGCVIILDPTLEITQPEILIASLGSQENVKCKGFTNGAVTINASGGTAPYTYSWGASGTGATKTDLSAGTYSIIVTDNNGCKTLPLEVVITEPNSFVEIVNIVTTSGCYNKKNGTAKAEVQGGTGSYSYLWSNGQTDQTATGLAPGNYSVTVNDGNDCETQKSVTITAPAELIITGFHTTETTSFGSATGTATVNLNGGTPGYTYLWSNGQTDQTAKNLVAGTYNVIVTDANKCKANKIVKIYDSLYTEIEASAICANTSDEIRTSYFKAINTKGGSGTYGYSWTFGDNKTATGPGQHTVKYGSSGQKTIILTLTDNDPVRRKPDGSKFTYTSSIIIYAGECFGKCGSEDLRTGDIYIGNATGMPYNVGQNCESVANEALWINITEPGESKRYDFYTEYVVLLYHPDGTVTEYSSLGQCSLGLINRDKPLKITNIDYNCGDRISVEKFFMSVSSNGNGCNSYTDGPKCTARDKPINVVTPLSGAAKGGELLCNGVSNGKITATASGGRGKYQFTINSTTTSFTFTSSFKSSGQYVFENLKADTYNVIIKDEDGRTYTVSNVKIIQPSNPLLLEEESRKLLTCNGGNNAEVTVNASGGTAPYIYVWKNGQTTKTAKNLSAGPNEVKVIDKNGCEFPLTIIIDQPPILIADAGPDRILNCGVTQVKLSAVFSPYTNPATGVQEFGEWTVANGPVGSNFTNPSNPESLFTIQTPGTYTLRWTVPCGATDDVNITISNCSTIDFDGIDDHIDFGDNFDPSGDFTFEAWIKQNTNATAGTKTILSKRDFSNLSSGFDLIIDNGFPKFRWNNSEITASNAIGKDRWYHLAVISNGSGTKLYVDGIDVGNGAMASPVENDFKFFIGAMFDSGTALNPKNYFHGWIEEVRIWNTSLTEEQLRFMMNQRIKEADNSNVIGVEIPLDVPKDLAENNLAWDRLEGYYQMEKVANGFAIGETASGIKGKLINIITTQERTAPLPYISAKAGLWFDDTTWLHPQVWDAPNSNGINTETINWNIARISHNINSGGKDLTVLGLLSKSAKLTIAKPGETLNEKNSGQSLTITHYLELNGNIDLVGESQLLQTEGSILKETSSGFIERDQQGTANSYNYNYWSSPVSIQGATIPINSGFTIGNVMLDGTNSATPFGLSFHDWYEYADGAYSTPRKISNYWLYKFMGTSNAYSEWKRVGSAGTLEAGEGYTMKGTSGGAEISDRQNYVFKGKPNNGNITLRIGPDQNYLLGNPYPSALNADQFILDNLKDGGTNPYGNIFNGALYFWDHFAGKTHILADYIGGYATYNLTGGVPAVATDERINNTGESSKDYFGDEAKIPQRYIPVAQGFFINTVFDSILSPNMTVDGGKVIFKNSQRAFKKETNPENSQFLRPETNSQKEKQSDTRSKIRLDFRSPMGYNRQILVGADPNTTNGFDLGYDAPLNDYNLEDMFWLIDNIEFVIQGVPNFEIDQVLPLGIIINKAGIFSIKINKLENVAEDVNIYLKNLQDSTYFDLRKGDYSMTLDPGNYYERFQIVFQNEKAPTEEPDSVVETEEETEDEATEEDVTTEEEQEQGAVETEEEEILEGEIKVFYVGNNREIAVLNPSKFKIERVVIYDMLGQIIQEYQNISNEKEVRLPVREFSAAVYAIKLYSGNKEISKSIILIR